MKYDVLIIGAGIAGLYTALSLPSNLKVLVLSKDEINNCNTYRAQGGIACVWDEDDDFEIDLNGAKIKKANKVIPAINKKPEPIKKNVGGNLNNNNNKFFKKDNNKKNTTKKIQ